MNKFWKSCPTLTGAKIRLIEEAHLVAYSNTWVHWYHGVLERKRLWEFLLPK